VGPFDRDPAVGEVDACAGYVRNCRKPALDRRHAGRAGNAVDGEIHARDAAVEMLNEMREVAGFGHGSARDYFSTTRLRDRNRRGPPRPASITRSHWPGGTSATAPR